MYLPIVSTIVDGQGLPTTVVIPGNNKKPSHIILRI
jgi:hypothetical protein